MTCVFQQTFFSLSLFCCSPFFSLLLTKKKSKLKNQIALHKINMSGHRDYAINTEIVELDLTQWSPSNTSLNATQPSASHSMVGASTNSVASAGSGIGSIHLTNVQLEYAPTASPELSLTNTGSSASNNQSILGIGTATTLSTTKREPYLRNWFMSQSSASSAHSANAASSNMPSHPNASGGNSVSANASPAASSLNAISMDSNESNYQKMKQFSLQQLHSADTQLPIENSSSTSSVLSSQHHGSIASERNASKTKFSTNGEHNGHGSRNQLNNSHSHSADVSVKDEQPKQSTSQQQKQQKSSRRTTSLLNLFMSNSQGNNNRAKTKTTHRHTHKKTKSNISLV